MNKLKCKFNGLTTDENNVMRITFKVANKSEANALVSALKLQGKIGSDLDITIKRHVEKRSKNANAYFWELCGKVAEQINVQSDEVYRKCIKENGVSSIIKVDKCAYQSFVERWEMRGLGWFCEKVDEDEESILVKVYYGSSTYNSVEMYNIIQSVITECKEYGIQTMTPKEIAELTKQYEKQYGVKTDETK